MSTYLYRLARWSVRRRLVVLLAWLVIAGAVITTGVLGGGKTTNSFSIPGTESQSVADLLAQKLPELSGGQAQIVFATPDANVTAGQYRSSIVDSVAALGAIPGVSLASDPFQTQAVSHDGHVALASVQFKDKPGNVAESTLDKVADAVQPAERAGVSVEFSGSVYPGYQPPLSQLPEIIGLIVAFLILLVTLGSLVAAGLPILAALLGVVISLSALLAVGALIDLSAASTTVTLMLGLSTGIDYGLFIVSRHRSQVLAGTDVNESIALAVGTAGSAVVFAGATVLVALAGMTVLNIPFVTVMGLAAAGGVLIAVLIAITLVPGLLGFAGGRVAKSIVLPGSRTKSQRRAGRLVADPESGAAGAWGRFVVRRRFPILIGGVALLLLAASPVTSMELGLPTAETQPQSSTARQAYELTSESFGVGFNGPLLITAEGISSPEQAQPLVTSLRELADVQGAVLAVQNNGVAVVNLVPKSGPNSKATADLVAAIRDNHRQLEQLSGSTRVLVGGLTASNLDVSNKIGAAIPAFLLVIVSIAFVLLTFAFRTFLVPLKSIVGFLLSVGAAMGMQVAVFQWGWGADLLGVTPGRIISFLPVLMLAIIFGLSADYEIFVVSRIKEHFTRTGDARASVIRGIAVSGRVVTAAALIMITIFATFILAPDPTLKSVGFSFAVGVFIDAFVVRLTLVPAFMAIAGEKIWRHPRWFARYVPDPDIEGEKLTHSLRGDLTHSR